MPTRPKIGLSRLKGRFTGADGAIGAFLCTNLARHSNGLPKTVPTEERQTTCDKLPAVELVQVAAAMLTHKIVSAISDAIYHRRLPPGTKLNEREIAELFGVSRTVVRQALIRLSQDRLVDVSPKRSSAVACPTFDDAYQLYQMLLVLESGVIDQLTESISAEDLDKLRTHTLKEQAAYESHDDDLGDKLGREFHSMLISFLKNDIINGIHTQLRRQEALINALYRSGFDYCKLRDEHTRLVDCIARKDSTSAKALLASHYNLVIRGYKFDVAVPPNIDLKEALGL